MARRKGGAVPPTPALVVLKAAEAACLRLLLDNPLDTYTARRLLYPHTTLGPLRPDLAHVQAWAARAVDPVLDRLRALGLVELNAGRWQCTAVGQEACRGLRP